MDALIIDDDPPSAEFAAAVLRSAGFACEKVYSGAQGLKSLPALRPRLVLLDIIMPGLDGMAVLRAIKAGPAGGPKVVVCSGKGYAQDREEARRLGADGFLTKPYEGEALLKLARSLLGAPEAPAQGARTPAFRVRVLGSQAPAPEGESPPGPCVLVEHGDRWLVLDAGTGLQALAFLPPPGHKEVWLLLTHYHPDHVDGLGALAALLDPSYSLKVGGPADTRLGLDAVLKSRLRSSRARLELFSLAEGAFSPFPGLGATAWMTQHPGPTLAFRLDAQGRSVVYCPDNELRAEERTDAAERMSRCIRGADLLLHDARYLDEDFPHHAGEGHSCPRLVAERATQDGVRSVAFFHMEPHYAPAQLEAAVGRTRAALGLGRDSIELRFGLPGTVLEV